MSGTERSQGVAVEHLALTGREHGRRTAGHSELSAQHGDAHLHLRVAMGGQALTRVAGKLQNSTGGCRAQNEGRVFSWGDLLVGDALQGTGHALRCHQRPRGVLAWQMFLECVVPEGEPALKRVWADAPAQVRRSWVTSALSSTVEPVPWRMVRQKESSREMWTGQPPAGNVPSAFTKVGPSSGSWRTRA